MRNTLTILFCVCASFFLNAQEPKGPLMKFTTQVHWVNTVFEGDIVEYKFPFVNAGDQPLIITEVIQQVFTPDCYRKEPVAPGDSGFITIRYLTAGQFGYLDKSTTIKSNSRKGDVTLFLRCTVYPRPEDGAAIMKFDSTTYLFDTVYQGSTVDNEFHFTNQGKVPLIISNVTGSSGSIVPEYPKEPIAPGQSAFIRVVFNTSGKYGPQDKCVTITSNATEPIIVLHIKGFVTLPPKDPDGPHIAFDNLIYNFDTVQQGEIVRHEFRFTNTGKSALVLSSVLGNGGGAMAERYSKEPIAPGKSGTILLIYDTSNKPGYHDKVFSVESNSTGGPVYIRLRGTVVAIK